MSASAASPAEPGQPGPAGRAPSTLLACVRGHRGPLLGGWRPGALEDAVERQADALAGERVQDEVVGLCWENTGAWVVGLLSLLRAGAHPLLLHADTPELETHRVLAAAGGGRYLVAGPGGAPLLEGSRA